MTGARGGVEGLGSPNSQNISKRHNSQVFLLRDLDIRGLKVLRTPRLGIKDDRPVGERELETEDPGPYGGGSNRDDSAINPERNSDRGKIKDYNEIRKLYRS